MRCAHQQPRRDSPALRDDQKAIPEGHSRENLRNTVETFGSGVQGHQAMMRFEKRRQLEDETIDKILSDLEMLRRRSQPDESNSTMIKINT